MDGGGALMNQSIHGIDAVQWLAASAMGESEGNPVDQVFAYTAKRGHDPELIEVEDTAVAILHFTNGALGQILGATSMFPGSLKRIQIAGRNGTAEVLEDELVTWMFREPDKHDDVKRSEYGSETQTGGGAGDPMAIDHGHHRRNFAAFVESIEMDRPFILCGSEARKAVAIIEAIYESARTGQSVDVN